MAAENALIELRDTVYARILLKRNSLDFTFNDFNLKKSWVPYTSIEEMNNGLYADGVVHVIGGLYGDRVRATRGTNTAVGRDTTVAAEYSVKVGYQKYLSGNVGVTTSIVDDLFLLVEELDVMCRKEIEIVVNGVTSSYSRTEFLKDENGVPFHFVRLAQQSTFEAYLEAFYTIPLV